MTKDLVERAVREGSVARKLYKYRAFDVRTFGILDTASMWFANPLEFNDPFDFQIDDSGAYSTAEIRTYLERNSVPARDVERIIAAGVSPDKLLAIIEKAKAASFAHKGVLCLSEVPDSMLMWSHYAVGHTGIAFELDVVVDPAFFVTPIKVHYVSDYPLTRYLVDGNDAVSQCIRTKAMDWSYEREVRIVKNNAGSQTFKRDALTAVYVGCRARSADVDKLARLLADGGYRHAALYQASRGRHSYGVTFRKL